MIRLKTIQILQWTISSWIPKSII